MPHMLCRCIRDYSPDLYEWHALPTRQTNAIASVTYTLCYITKRVIPCALLLPRSLFAVKLHSHSG